MVNVIIQAQIDADEVRRKIGMGNRSSMKPVIENVVSEAIEKSPALITPLQVSRKFAVVGADDTEIFLEGGISLKGSRVVGGLKGSSHLVFVIVSIGPGIDEMVKRLTEEKKLFEAFVYDAIGSSAAEGLASSFQKEQDEVLIRSNLTSTIRFSPGYCDWPIEGQRMLFDLFGGDTAGVELTPSCLMLPRKSVSGVFGIIEASDDLLKSKSTHNPCRMCTQKNCQSRRR